MVLRPRGIAKDAEAQIRNVSVIILPLGINAKIQINTRGKSKSLIPVSI
jgi:hypothetical protein